MILRKSNVDVSSGAKALKEENKRNMKVNMKGKKKKEEILKLQNLHEIKDLAIDH